MELQAPPGVIGTEEAKREVTAVEPRVAVVSHLEAQVTAAIIRSEVKTYLITIDASVRIQGVA